MDRGRGFDADIIELCVRWYMSYRPSYRDCVELMADRGVATAHSTIMRWVIRYVSEFKCGARSGGLRAAPDDFSAEHSQALQDPARCVGARGCNESPTLSGSNADAPRTSGSSSPDTPGGSFRSHARRSRWPWDLGVLDQTKCDPAQGDHALIVPHHSILSRQAPPPSRTQFLRSTGRSHPRSSRLR